MKTLKTNGLMQSTTDFAQFKFREDNRSVVDNHVEKLKFSIKKSNDLHLNPIIVNEKMEVIDGQHRLLAAKSLEVEIFYLIDNDYSPDKMITFNTMQKKWAVEDYLNYWISHGRSDYQKLKDFKDDLGFPIHLVLCWLSKTGQTDYKTFRTGGFKLKIGEDVLESIFMMKKLIEHMKDRNFKPTRTYHHINFHIAAKKIFLNPIVEPERFFERLELVPFQIRYCVDWQQYLEQLIDIYNYDMRRDRLKVVSDGEKREITR